MTNLQRTTFLVRPHPAADVLGGTQAKGFGGRRTRKTRAGNLIGSDAGKPMPTRVTVRHGEERHLGHLDTAGQMPREEDGALALQSQQVLLRSVCGPEAKVLGDLNAGRRATYLGDLTADEVVDLLLAKREMVHSSPLLGLAAKDAPLDIGPQLFALHARVPLDQGAHLSRHSRLVVVHGLLRPAKQIGELHQPTN